MNPKQASPDRVEAYRRKLAWRKTPQQRMREMELLQERMWATLRGSPQGYQHFLRRNFKARAIRLQRPHA